MYICDECAAVFDAGECESVLINCLPYGEEYAREYARGCPLCGSIDMSEAVQCAECGDWTSIRDSYLNDSMEYICEKCNKEESEET